MQKYKYESDKRFRREPQIHVGNELYIDLPQPAAFASHSGQEFARKDYSKLIRQTRRTYTVTEVQLRTASFDEDSKPYLVAIYTVLSNQKSTQDTNKRAIQTMYR